MIENNDKGPKGPRIYLPNLFAQAQNFWISTKKKASLGVRSPCIQPSLYLYRDPFVAIGRRHKRKDSSET